MGVFGLLPGRAWWCFRALHWPVLSSNVALFLLGSPPALADWPKPVTSPKSTTPAPVKSSSGPSPAPILAPDTGALPGTVATTGQPLAPTPVDPAYASLPPLIEQMLGGKITPQRAWDAKLLSVNDLLWIFTAYLQPWGSFKWRFNVPLIVEAAVEVK